MKALIVSPVPTDPVNAGNRARIATMTGLFAHWGWDVHFAFVPMEPADSVASSARFGAGRFHRLKYAQPMPSWPVRIMRKVARLAKLNAGYLWALDAWYDEQLTPQLQALHAVHGFDLVCVEYVFMSKALEAFGGQVIKILDTHDCFAERHRRYLQQGQEPQWFSTSEEDETRGFLRAHAVLAIQPQEAKEFGARVTRHAAHDCAVLEFGHILPEVEAVGLSNAPVGIFLGSDNPINVTALRWFIGEVMPMIKREVPGFRLKVVGSVCNAIGASDQVDKLGFVDDLALAFAQACVNVNPVQMGTGVNIKLLDAMMYGMPCISTEVGVRGLEQYAEHGICVVPDNDSGAFARAVVVLLRSRDIQVRYATGARVSAQAWNIRQSKNLEAWISSRRRSAS